jgi:hypothetical protein
MVVGSNTRGINTHYDPTNNPFYEEIHSDTQKVIDDALRFIKDLGGIPIEMKVKSIQYRNDSLRLSFNSILQLRGYRRSSRETSIFY